MARFSFLCEDAVECLRFQMHDHDKHRRLTDPTHAALSKLSHHLPYLSVFLYKEVIIDSGVELIDAELILFLCRL